MKILIIAMNFPPELTGIGKYVGEMTEWLGAQRFDVRVITAPPYYPAWRVSHGHSAWRYTSERVGSARVYRCPLYVPSRPGGANRVLHLGSFAIASLPVILWHGLLWRPDIVFLVEPPIGCAPAALIAARLGGARSWLHIQDFELDAAFGLRMLRAPRLQRVLLGLERWLMRRFDRVSTISSRMVERVAAKGVAESRRMLFPNWVDLDRIRPIAGDVPLRRELGIAADVQVLLYAGSFGHKQGLELLLEVAQLLQGDSRFQFVLCGDGPTRAVLEREAEGLDNLRFLPLQPAGRLNELMNLADIHLLPQRADAEDLVMPSKLTTMMASGRPVIATARADTEIARVAARGGRVVPPGDALAFARSIRELANDPGLRAQLGEAGRQAAFDLWERGGILARTFGPAHGGTLVPPHVV